MTTMEFVVISHFASPASDWRIPALSREEGEGAGRNAAGKALMLLRNEFKGLLKLELVTSMDKRG